MKKGCLLLPMVLVLLTLASPPPADGQVTIHNPWLVNDRVADTHNLATMGATYVNAYTPDGVVAPANDEAKAINIYNNQKRRLYHWGGRTAERRRQQHQRPDLHPERLRLVPVRPPRRPGLHDRQCRRPGPTQDRPAGPLGLRGASTTAGITSTTR